MTSDMALFSIAVLLVGLVTHSLLLMGSLSKLHLQFLCIVSSSDFCAENISSLKAVFIKDSPLYAVSKSRTSYSDASIPEAGFDKLNGSESNSLIQQARSCTTFSSIHMRLVKFLACCCGVAFSFAVAWSEALTLFPLLAFCE